LADKENVDQAKPAGRNDLEAEQAPPDKRLELLQKNQSILESAVRRLDVADKRWSGFDA